MIKHKANSFACFWPDLPSGRADIDRVHDLLVNWAALAGIDRAPRTRDDLFFNSVIHVLECALLQWLAPYASRQGIGSDIFQDSEEFRQACFASTGRSGFQPGYPREMATALMICYALEEPWSLEPVEANGYAEQLTARLKDIALYDVEPSAYWKQKHEKFTRGRRPGAISDLKKYVASVLDNSDLKLSAKELWKVLVKDVANIGSADQCPLEIDGQDLYVTAESKKYAFNRFQKHLSALKNKK